MLQQILALGMSVILVLPTPSFFQSNAELGRTWERAAGVPAEGEDHTIRARVEEVRVGFNVRDRRGSVNNFSEDDFTVLDDGHAVAAFTSFSRDSSAPLHIGLLMDRSASMAKGFVAERVAARKFLERVLRPETDSLFLQDFSVQSSLQHLSSGDLRFIAGRVESVRPGGHTALFDALVNGSETMLATSEAEPARRVIILLSDGDDNYSQRSLEDAIEAAQRADIAIYAITAHGLRWVYQGDLVLEQLAAATGGRAFILKNFDGVDRVFAEIENELRTQYWVTYRPSRISGCGFHRLEVVPHNPKLHARSRQGYYACVR